MIGENGIYQNAVDACNQHGGEVLLTISNQENIETANFITANRNILGGEKIVWLRAKNPGLQNSPHPMTDDNARGRMRITL